ncbi:MAG TPA: triose-phosphate isomerase [Gammaproteobacteria bacterium]|nr:triose-phosphate isomerase [Gammaproteobacteria bacterium]
MARKALIAGNWKMNGSLGESRKLVEALRAGVGAGASAEMLLAPPYVYLAAVKEWIAGSPLLLGAQDVADKVGSGAFTGEVSGAMLAEIGCGYAIVGHSERRTLYGETDEIVAAKFKAAQAAKLVPILCVGETLAERDAGATQRTVSRQLDAVLAAAGVESFRRAVVAYEPVWAIGTGRTATPEQAQEVHSFLRALVAGRDATIAAGLRILYGGSVKGANARALFDMDDIDGGLVGGASLVAAEFLEIFRAAS